MPKATDHVYDLVDVVHQESPDAGGEEIIVIDGRIYERELRLEDRVYDLVDVFAVGRIERICSGAVDEEMRKIASEMAERIARELIPGIAERIIRQEIEKLKGEEGDSSLHPE